MNMILLLAGFLLIGNAPDKNDPAAVARQVFEAFNAHDWKRMESLYAQDVEMMDPAFEGIRKGKEGMTEFYKTVPDIHDEVKTLSVAGDTVVVEFVSTGTIEGRKFELKICTVFKIEKGMVVSDHTYYDK